MGLFKCARRNINFWSFGRHGSETNDIFDCFAFSLRFQLFVRNDDVLMAKNKVYLALKFNFNNLTVTNVSKKGLQPQGEMPRGC
jgi:hypothetical protein